MRICCLSLLFMTVHEGYLVFGLLVGQKKKPEDATQGNRDENLEFCL